MQNRGSKAHINWACEQALIVWLMFIVLATPTATVNTIIVRKSSM